MSLACSPSLQTFHMKTKINCFLGVSHRCRLLSHSPAWHRSGWIHGMVTNRAETHAGALTEKHVHKDAPTPCISAANALSTNKQSPRSTRNTTPLDSALAEIFFCGSVSTHPFIVGIKILPLIAYECFIPPLNAFPTTEVLAPCLFTKETFHMGNGVTVREYKQVTIFWLMRRSQKFMEI